MAYAYFKSNKHKEPAIFDLFFRTSPFKGHYTVFAGLDECLKFIQSFRFTENDIVYLKTLLSHAEPEFFDYLLRLDCSEIKVYSFYPGQLVFPREPLLRIEGPVIICQLLETTLLSLVNYSSLVATNASRFRLLSPNLRLLEFGLRRAQGPDGGLSASKYAYVGGFDGTSNVLAGKLYGIPVGGTLAHSYVCSFTGLKDLTSQSLTHPTKLLNQKFETTVPLNSPVFTNFVGTVLDALEALKEVKTEGDNSSDSKKTEKIYTNEGELASFISFAQAWPHQFLALIDTYDVNLSGVVNFLAVAVALDKAGYKAVGVRLDSGDLALFSKQVRAYFKRCGEKFERPYFAGFGIVASDDINEDRVEELEKAGHSINSFGIGTNLVTCQKQPALGCVYKLVELNQIPRIKLATAAKMPLPARKSIYRLWKKSHDEKTLVPIADVITLHDDPPPEANKEYAIISPTSVDTKEKESVTPVKVDHVLKEVWDGKRIIDENKGLSSLQEMRNTTLENLKLFIPNVITLRGDGPAYPVKVSLGLHSLLHGLIRDLAKKSLL